MFNLRSTTLTLFLTTFMLFLIFAPLPSHAQFLETGPSCTPEVIPDLGDIPTPATVVACPWCEKNGSTKLRLTWDLDQKNLGDHFCYISCENLLDNRYCSPVYAKDFEGVGTTSLRYSWNLRQKDEVYMTGVREGNEYTISCLSREGKGSVSSAHVKVNDDCRVPCEVPFDTIANELGGKDWSLSNFFRITITEEDLAKWANDTSDQDHAYFSGSGNQYNIILYMMQTQLGLYSPEASLISNKNANPTCPVQRNVYFNSEIIYVNNLDSAFFSQELKSYVNDYGYPMEVTVRGIDWGVYLYEDQTFQSLIPDSHSVIVTFIEDIGEQENTSPYFNLKILDPNRPEGEISFRNCKPAFLYIESSGYDKLSFGGFGCEPEADYYGDNVFIFSDKSLYSVNPGYDWIEAYHQFKTGLCFEGSAQSYTDFCQRGKLTDWLRNNLTKLENPSGSCYAWTMFMLKVAYLGDFVGTDYHPDDGKYVGVDCDANHYPTNKDNKSNLLNNFLQKFKRSSIDSDFWLANLLQPFRNLKLK